jgi:hypothetical protein
LVIRHLQSVGEWSERATEECGEREREREREHAHRGEQPVRMDLDGVSEILLDPLRQERVAADAEPRPLLLIPLGDLRERLVFGALVRVLGVRLDAARDGLHEALTEVTRGVGGLEREER